jgi:hypothetical protein
MPPVKQTRSEPSPRLNRPPKLAGGAQRSQEGAGGMNHLRQQVRSVGYDEGSRRLSPKRGATQPRGMEVEPVDFKEAPGGKSDPRGMEVEPVDFKEAPGGKSDPRGMEVEPVDFKVPKSSRPADRPAARAHRPRNTVARR